VQPLAPFSSGLLLVLTKLLKDPSPLGRWGVNAMKLLWLPMLQPRAPQGRRPLLPRPGLALGV
jgi:hypothetical protein